MIIWRRVIYKNLEVYVYCFKNSFNIKKCYELARFFSLLSQFEVDELLFVASKKCLSKTGHKNVVLKERGFFYLL